MTEHPVTPSWEQLQQWINEEDGLTAGHIATRAAQWGADQELEACCSIALVDPVCGTKHQRSMLVRHIRERRRPKPPSLKKQALDALNEIEDRHAGPTIQEELIRRALEALPE
jgi:hypothetical protein